MSIQPSRTAMNMATFRALETTKPHDKRLFADKFASRFLPRRRRLLLDLAGWGWARSRIERYADYRLPGARTSAIARTRLIDDWIKDDLEVGLRQLVILGAGFDCRAVRLPISSDLEIFEIDRKPVIDVKEFLLAGCVTRPVKRLPMDFQNDDLSEVLRDAGFNCDLKTLFIWEGVTNYLDQTSVHGVFNFIGRNAKPGSRLVFTYVDAKAVAGDFDAPGLSRLLEDLQELGEPWTFGIHPENVSEQLRSCGLKLCEDLDAATYRQRFGITDSGYEFYHAVLSEVADAPGKA